MDSYERVHEHLATLGMDTIEKTIENYLENARDKSFLEVFDHLLSEEVKSKRSSSIRDRAEVRRFPLQENDGQVRFLIPAEHRQICYQ